MVFRQLRFLLLIPIVILLLAFPRWMREREKLLPRATAAASTAGWIQSYGGYFWESPHSVLYFTITERRGQLALPGQSSRSPLSTNMPIRTYPQLIANRFDTDTHKSEPLNALSSQFPPFSTEPAEWRLSPDGRILLWLDSRNKEWVGSTLDGKTVRRWPALARAGAQALWMNANSRWVELSEGTHLGGLQLHDTNPSVESVQQDVGQLDWTFAVLPDQRLFGLRFDFATHRLEGVAHRLPVMANNPEVLFSTRMSRQINDVAEAEVSPDGQKVAFITFSRHLTPLQQLYRVITSDRSPMPLDASLWLMPLDGDSPTLVGTIADQPVGSLLWTPDGKRLSFITRQTLYTVPAR